MTSSRCDADFEGDSASAGVTRAAMAFAVGAGVHYRWGALPVEVVDRVVS